MDTDPDVETSAGIAPIITAINIDSQGKFAGDNISIIATVNDPDNDITAYDWYVSDGSFVNVTDKNVTWTTPDSGGIHTVSLTVTDSKGNSDTSSQTIDLEESTGTFQKFLSATYRRLYSESDMIVIDDYIYYYSAEDTGTGTSYRLKKIGLDGHEIWSKTYANFSTDWREISRILKTNDGNMILGVEGAIIKVDTEGNILWNFPKQNLYRFIELDNGNYFFIGAMIDNGGKPSYHILTPHGSLVEEGIFEFNYDVGFYDIVEGTSSNTFFVLAYVFNPDSPNTHSEIFEIDSSGNVLNAYDFPYNPRTNGRLFKESDGTYSAFFSNSVNTERQIDWINISDNGNIISSNTYSFNDYTEAFDIDQIANGGYLIAGASGTGSNSANSLIFKTNVSGEVVWNFSYGDTTDKLNFASSILELTTGHILISGSSYDFNESKIKNYLFRHNADGSL